MRSAPSSRRAVLLTATLGLVLAACTPGSGQRAMGASPSSGRLRHDATTSPSTVPEAGTAPVTPIAWRPCGDDLQCGELTVPLDYALPRGPTIEIAVERRPAGVPSQRIGSLVINPGGPGGSGIDDLPQELQVLTPELLARFDIVSFDPRGVQRSSPVHCEPSPGAAASPAPSSTASSAAASPGLDPVPSDAATRHELLQADEVYAAACERYSGALLPYVGTVDVARDLDRLRIALGDTRLTFIGHSYGTLLGATYAQMFPTHVRAMVLDGAVDPALSASQMVIEQSASFEQALNSFFAWCAVSSSCAWHVPADPTDEVASLLASLQVHPLPAAGNVLVGPGQLYDALLEGLYSSSSWPTLGAALAEAFAGDGTAVASMSGAYNTSNSTNADDANSAIGCLDHPVPSAGAFPGLAADAARSAPIFGPLLAWQLLTCAVWPVRPTRQPAPTVAAGAPPILVVGTTGDPATPYEWAVHLAGELQRGVLLTWRGDSHVAYYYSACVRSIDQAYLVGGTLPRPGTVCTD